MTGQQRDLEPDFGDHAPWIDCWQCGGEGKIASCWEEYACIDPEGGCDECAELCGICHGKGGWPAIPKGEDR